MIKPCVHMDGTIAVKNYHKSGGSLKTDSPNYCFQCGKKTPWYRKPLSVSKYLKRRKK